MFDRDHQQVAHQHLENYSTERLDRDWMFYDYFGCIYVINLDQKTDRLEKITHDLQDVGIQEFNRLPAIKGHQDVPESLWKKMDRNWAKIDLSTEEGRRAFDHQRQGEMGCYLSHLKVLQIVKEHFDQAHIALQQALQANDADAFGVSLDQVRRYSSVLILEDDNAFGIVEEEGTQARLQDIGRLFRQAMAELPPVWDMCYFMAWSKTPEKPISRHIVKLQRATCNNAYAVHSRFYETAIGHLQRLLNEDQVEPLDNALAQLQPEHHCYAINPSIAYQRAGTSSITQRTRAIFRQHQPVFVAP